MKQLATLCCQSIYQDILIGNIKKSQWGDDLEPSPAHASGGDSWRTSWKGEMIINRYWVDAHYDIGGRNRKKIRKEDSVQILWKSLYWKSIVETKISKDTILCSTGWECIQECNSTLVDMTILSRLRIWKVKANRAKRQPGFLCLPPIQYWLPVQPCLL